MCSMARGITWSPETVDKALHLRAEGSSTYEIGRILGVPRASVANWCRGRVPMGRREQERCPQCGGRPHERIAAKPYAYLLGLYLGDGCLSTPGRQVWLSIAMDTAYPGIAAECREAISSVLEFRTSNARVIPGKNLLLIRSYGREWLCLFPQHGPGRKHKRCIVLAPWQQELVDAHPGQFLRGLIHSDGWRGINRVRVKGKDYAYPRYQFSNRSEDIRTLFTNTCDRLDISWRRWGRWHISVARRDSVARLDEFVGPKY
jgi:hypothetical protein